MKLIADVGGTKGSWVIFDKNDTRHIHTAGFNPYINNELQIKEKIISHFQETASSISNIYFYGAGCSDKQKNDIVKNALTSIFVHANIEVNHDLLAAARATCGSKKGITCILGTGSNSCLYDGEKIVDNVPSLGYVLGDEGSGNHLGKALLKAYYYRAMPPHLRIAFEMNHILDKVTVLNQIYQNPQPNAFLASFTKFLSANLHEPFIHQLVAKCFDEFLDEQVSKYEQCSELPIHFVGSVAYFFQEILILCLQKRNWKLGNIIQEPIQHLLTFHKKDRNT